MTGESMMMEYCAKIWDRQGRPDHHLWHLGARGAIRDVGRVMDIPLTEVDRIAKLVPNIPGKRHDCRCSGDARVSEQHIMPERTCTI